MHDESKSETRDERRQTMGGESVLGGSISWNSVNGRKLYGIKCNIAIVTTQKTDHSSCSTCSRDALRCNPLFGSVEALSDINSIPHTPPPPKASTRCLISQMESQQLPLSQRFQSTEG